MTKERRKEIKETFTTLEEILLQTDAVKSIVTDVNFLELLAKAKTFLDELRQEPLIEDTLVNDFRNNIENGVHRDIYAATPHFPLDFRIRIYYNIRMKKKPSEKSRPRAEILAEIAALPPSVQGTISSYRCPRKNGPPAVYHNLQYTRGGKNHSFSIPVDKVSEFKAAVAAGRKLRDLVFELSLADANEIASSGSALKKNSRTSS